MKNPRYFIDVEAYSECDLRKHGAVRYSKDPSTVITVLSVLDTETDTMTTLVNPKYMVGYKNDSADKKRVKEIFMDILNDRELYASHNILFEYVMINEHISRHIPGNYGGKWRIATLNGTCTKDLAAMRGLGALKLEDVAKKILETGGKNMAGHNLMKLVCKPSNPGRKVSKFYDDVLIADEEGIFRSEQISEDMIRYCEDDVRTSYEVWKLLKLVDNDPQFGDSLPHVRTACRQTRKANIQGVRVDLKLAKLLVRSGEQYQESADKEVSEVWDGLRANQSAKIKQALGPLLPKGVQNKGTGAKDLEYYRLELADHPKLLSMIEVVAECRSASWKKARKLLDTHWEGRIYDMLQFFGALTGRWTSRGFQLQNLPRPTLDMEDFLVAMNELPSRVDRGDITIADKNIISSAIRSLLLPDHGEIFLSADLAQIELRMGLFLAGDMEALKIQHTDDLYLKFARSVFGNHVTSKCKERQIGKTAILSLLYGTGAKTLRGMILAQSGINVDIDTIKNMKKSFISQFPKVASQWEKYDKLLKAALPTGKLTVKLKSGRKLTYKGIRRKLVPTERNGRVIQMWQTVYKGPKGEDGLYGSKIFNHVTQSSATDLFTIKLGRYIMANSILAGFRFSVHDEVVSSVFKAEDGEDYEHLKKSWTDSGNDTIQDIWPGILLASDFKEMNHYFK